MSLTIAFLTFLTWGGGFLYNHYQTIPWGGRMLRAPQWLFLLCGRPHDQSNVPRGVLAFSGVALQVSALLAILFALLLGENLSAQGTFLVFFGSLPIGAVLTYLLSLGRRYTREDALLYLMQRLGSDDPKVRQRTIVNLISTGWQRSRDAFIEVCSNDPDELVRAEALHGLGIIYSGERDIEVLQLALDKYDNPGSGILTRQVAGQVMIMINGLRKKAKGQFWRMTAEAQLQHPILLQAVAETRRILAEENNKP
ncbi:MAG: HEAT repeat domain-containing protein [Chloroflexi bacterium]|nr:HEAT repeat domain-containing protein [Chloroflexota bacterium]